MIITGHYYIYAYVYFSRAKPVVEGNTLLTDTCTLNIKIQYIEFVSELNSKYKLNYFVKGMMGERETLYIDRHNYI